LQNFCFILQNILQNNEKKPVQNGLLVFLINIIMQSWVEKFSKSSQSNHHAVAVAGGCHAIGHTQYVKSTL